MRPFSTPPLQSRSLAISFLESLPSCSFLSPQQDPDHNTTNTASSNNNRGNGNGEHGHRNNNSINPPIGRFALSVDSMNCRAEPHDAYQGMIPTPAAAAAAGLSGVAASGANDRDGGRSAASEGNERGRGHSDASTASSDCGGSYYRPHQYPVPQQAATPMDLLTSQPPPRTKWRSGGGVRSRAGGAAGWPSAAASAKAGPTLTVRYRRGPKLLQPSV